jgi:hypothetical protein
MSTTIDEIEIETALAIPPAKPATDHNGNPVRYTGPGYTWEPGRKTSSGSFLRIQRDGTVTYSNPNCLKYAAPGSKPFKMPALKPRIETPGATGFSKAFERIKDSIQKRMLKNARANFGRYNGTPCLDGWEIVSTDGKTALLKPGAGVGTRTPILDIWAGAARKVGLLDNPEFHLALKRAALMVDERAPRVRLIGNPGELRITSEHGEPVRQTAGNDAGDFEETLPVTSWEPWHVAINPEFLEPMCGAWPLTVWYAGDTNAIVFEADDLSFRYVVMPLGDKWDGVDLSRTWDGVTPGRADAALEPEAEPEPVPLNLADFFPEPEPEAVESDLCPICGDTVTLKETRTKDGRLIGSCGDAFTSAQWNSGRDAIVSKEPATIAATEPEPVPTWNGVVRVLGDDRELYSITLPVDRMNRTDAVFDAEEKARDLRLNAFCEHPGDAQQPMQSFNGYLEYCTVCGAVTTNSAPVVRP